LSKKNVYKKILAHIHLYIAIIDLFSYYKHYILYSISISIKLYFI